MEVDQEDVAKKIDKGPSSDDGDESPSTPETLMSGIAILPMRPAFNHLSGLTLQRTLQASSPTMLARSPLSTPAGSSGPSTPSLQCALQASSPTMLARSALSTPDTSGPSTPAMRASPANLALMSPKDVAEEDKWTCLFHALRKSPEISKYAPSTSTTVTSMSRLDISTSDVDDGENRCKQLEAKIEPLIQKLKGITGYNGTGRYRRRRILERRRSKVKRELAQIWKELMILKQDSERNQHKRWSVNEEVRNLFSVALKLSYPQFKDEESTVVFSIREYGEYHCEDVLKIWPRLREEGKVHLGPRMVGWQIKKNLQLQQPDMIHGEPWVFDIGFVTINLSGKWMAKSLHMLLRDGVDTWAPPLFAKNYLVNIYFPTCDIDLSDMDSSRREVIKKTLINILEYCKVDWCSMPYPCLMDLPQKEYDKFKIIRSDGDVLIYRSAGGQHEPLIHAKIDSSNPLEDLKSLWYRLKVEGADWIVCLTHVQQQEYIKMCFGAAQHAKWLPPDRKDVPRSSYTGYESCSTSMEDLVGKVEDLASFLGKVEAKVSKAGYTTEEALNCAVKYTFLKNHRLAVCTLSFEEMFNEQGNTFLYLVNTQVRNRSFTKKHRKGIDQLKKASELTLGEGEVWEEGVERVLVLHLLKFTQVIAMSCYPVLPHKLCKYLYELSERFNTYCDSWEVGIAETKLLLCKATEVVMEKCFDLLGITPESSSLRDKQESLGLPKSFLQVGRLNHEDPPKKPNPRFQLFSVYIHITRDPTLRECMLFGKITISDTYGVLYDGWGLPDAPDRGTVALFDCDRDDQMRVTNHGKLDLGNPSSSNLVPLSSFMEISTELYASSLTEDALFPLSRLYVEKEFTYFWKMEDDTKCDMLPLRGKDGDVRMYYVLLKDAIDCDVEVTYDFKEDREVYAEVYAFYGSDFFDENEDPFVKNFYTASLYEGSFDGKVGKVPLKRTMMAVPAKGSIVIKARLHDFDTKEHGYLDGGCTFYAQPRDAFKKEIRGSCSCCSLSVRVVWSQG